MAKENPFRFSTKYQDDETDLLYYGYRYYNASTGRWLSRDPKGELGGRNFYHFSFNSPLNACDPLGLSPLWYTLEVDPSETDDPAHVGFYPKAIFLPVTYPNDGEKCDCRGRLLGIATGAAWIDLSTSFSLKDVQPDYYKNVVSLWPYWNAAYKRVVENPRYVGAGFTANLRQTPGAAQACCRNLVWYNYKVHGWWWPDTADGHFGGTQFVDSPGGLRPPASSFTKSYMLVLRCEDPGWSVEELGQWYWGVDVNFGAWEWTGTFYPPTANVIR